ncbi:MAG: hypothetical protein Q4C59_10410 [Lachnospiraceae bacterium]|nr:hypothetical protein [Lachnospiraceae bacterium]
MNKKWKKATGTVLFLLSAFLCLNGCGRLARGDGGDEQSGDTMIGVYVTTEYVDPMELTGELQLSWQDIRSGKWGKERLYGTVDWEKETVVFPGISGYALLYGGVAEETYANVTDPVFTDIRISVSDHSYSLRGTIRYNGTSVARKIGYLSRDGWKEDFSEEEIVSVEAVEGRNGETEYTATTIGEELYFYLNPVFHTAEGEIYLVPGSGTGASSEGASSTEITYGETDTSRFLEKEAEKETVNELTFGVDFAPQVPAVREKVIQYDGMHNIIEETEFNGDAVPEKIVRRSETAYMLVEKTYADVNGDDRITYEVINRDETSYTAYQKMDTLVLMPIQIEIADTAG